MARSDYSRSMSQHQTALLERALLVLANMDEGGWREMPHDLRLSFAKYMHADVWTRLPDVLSLRESAVLVVRDAIARSGEFSPEAADQSTVRLKSFAAK